MPDSPNPYSSAEFDVGPEECTEDRAPVDLLSATSIVAASMIGAGVYTTSGFSIADLQSPWLVVAAWAVAGIIAISGAICYGALAAKFTESGGEYLFLARSLHPVAGMMAGWVSLLAGFTGAAALAAATFATYLQPLLPESLADHSASMGCALVLVAALMHSIDVKPGARIQDAIVVLKFALIAGFLILALPALVRGVAANWGKAVPPRADDSWIGLVFATQLMWISLSYSGFQAAVYVAGEVKDAKRNVPRAIFLGTVLVTIVYVLINSVFVLAVDNSLILGQASVATIVARAIGGESIELFVRVIILVGLMTSVSALTMTGPRVYSKMAEDGFLPLFLHKPSGPPIVAIWLQAILTIVVIQISTLRDLLGYLGFTLSVSAALSVAMLFFIRRDGIRVPFFPLPPIVFVGATLLTATLSAVREPKEAMVGAATIVFGALLYPFFSKRYARTA